MNEVFRFKQFNILQKDSTMKVNTDGVLLGAWCDIEGRTKALMWVPERALLLSCWLRKTPI